MIKFKKHGTLLAILLFISGCNTCISNKKSETILNREKALVVFATKTQSMISIYDDYPFLVIPEWENAVDENDTVPKKGETLNRFWGKNNNLQAYIINPGTYQLATLTYYPNRILGADKPDTSNSTTYFVQNPISFTVHAGEVIYLGQIEFIFEEGEKLTYDVIDNYDLAYKHSHTMFPQLKHRLRRKLISLPSS